MKMIYISHPYTSDPENNAADAAKKTAELVKKDGKSCFINPLALFDGFECYGLNILAYCLEVVGRCDEIFMCDGWDESVGCQAEYAEALRCGLKVTFEHTLV